MHQRPGFANFEAAYTAEKNKTLWATEGADLDPPASMMHLQNQGLRSSDQVVPNRMGQ